MKWTNVRLIVTREIRDQLRDRRTIFVIAILPILLYPLLGISFLQVMQFRREHQTRVWVIGHDQLPTLPPLIEGSNFAPSVLQEPEGTKRYAVQTAMPSEFVSESESMTDERVREIANERVRQGEYDAVVWFSPEFCQSSHLNHTDQDPMATSVETFGPEIFFDQTKAKSSVARDRVVTILTRWRSLIVEQSSGPTPPPTPVPFQVVAKDLSGARARGALLWSRILPFVVIIWAVTGAFYPAIDLCAGEKERGTLETLLSCPASRQEIVWGKMITVMAFSMATSLLNLASMGFTGRFIVSQLQALAAPGLEMGPPPVSTACWLVVALIPISSLFSALSLALASMARSSKEGQYYLMPLMLATLPLLMLPMFPAVELDLPNSLIPVTGVILLLQSLIEGHYADAIRFALPVIAVTAVCCWLAMQWALHQFQDESVLFHESERFDLRTWFVHLFRDREATPTIAQAFLCGVFLLIGRFVAPMILPNLGWTWHAFMLNTALLQIVLFALPAILMAVLLTRRPGDTLLLRTPRPFHLLAAGLLAIGLHPVAASIAYMVSNLYPLSEAARAQLAPLASIMQGAKWWELGLLFGVLPAICEELSFRGFVLSGLRRIKNPMMAILISSLFFGIAHQILQQSLTAFVLGLVLAYVAIRTGSILPGMLFHCLHNSLMLAGSVWASEPPTWLARFVSVQDQHILYAWPVVIAGGLLAASMLYLLSGREIRLRYNSAPVACETMG